MLTGRAVRDGEPLWTAEDTELAVALTAIETATCACGHDRRESMRSENEYAYVAKALRCHACAARDRKAAEFQDAGGSLAGLAITVEKRTTKGGGVGD